MDVERGHHHARTRLGSPDLTVDVQERPRRVLGGLHSAPARECSAAFHNRMTERSRLTRLHQKQNHNQQQYQVNRPEPPFYSHPSHRSSSLPMYVTETARHSNTALCAAVK